MLQAIHTSKLFCSLALAGALLAAPAAGQDAQPPAPDRQLVTQQLPTLADVLEQTLPAVVSIAVRTETQATTNPLFNDPFFRRFFGDQLPQQPQPQPRPRQRMSAGSGVIVDAEEGYILTNHHVVAGGEEISVTLDDGRVFTAELVGSDQATDVGLLRIAASGLAQLDIRDSSELRVGDHVVAIGNPFGLGQTVTSGIVSALGRTGLNIEGYEDFIQTDASINPGNSGGALVDLNGQLVGINTAIIAPAGGNVGIGFAIPTNIAASVMTQLIAHGEVQRGQLGVAIQDVTPDLAAALDMPRASGALVSSVVPGSAAEAAGIEPGDVILAVDGVVVAGSAALRTRVGLTPSGTELELRIWRDGEELDVNATIASGDATTASLPADPARPAGPLAGAVFNDHESGAVVAELPEGSPAEAAGLQQGDVITGVNRRPVADAQQLADMLEAMEGTLVLQVIRNDAEMVVVVR